MDINILQIILDELIKTCAEGGDEEWICMLLDALTKAEE